MHLNFLDTHSFNNFLFSCALAQIASEDKILLTKNDDDKIIFSACLLNNNYISYDNQIYIEDSFFEMDSIYYPDIYKKLSSHDKQIIKSFIPEILNHKDIQKHLPIIENIPLNIISPYLPSVLNDKYAFIWRYGQKFPGETVDESFEDGRLIVPDKEMIQKYYNEKEFPDKLFPDKLLTPAEWPFLNKEDAIKYHHQRIAQLAHNLPTEPITITQDWEGIAISDGYHRYCAHIFKDRDTIPIKYNQNLIMFMNHIKSKYYENEFLNILSKQTNNPILCYSNQEKDIQIQGVMVDDFFITAISTISLDKNNASSYFVDIYDSIDYNIFNTIPKIIQLPINPEKYNEAMNLVNFRMHNLNTLLKNEQLNINATKDILKIEI